MIDIYFERCIAVAYNQRQQFWDWARDSGIHAEIWGSDSSTRQDFWHIVDDQKRAWAALKWA